MKQLVPRLATLVISLAMIGALAGCAQAPEECEVCHRPMHAETYYEVHLEGGDSRSLCCPRCGLRFQQERTDVAFAEVADYATKKVFTADEAFFVDDSSVHACAHSRVQEDRSGTQYQVAWDRCLPSLVAFESRSAAADFSNTHGGTIKTYDELVAEAR